MRWGPFDEWKLLRRFKTPNNIAYKSSSHLFDYSRSTYSHITWAIAIDDGTSTLHILVHAHAAGHKKPDTWLPNVHSVRSAPKQPANGKLTSRSGKRSRTLFA